MALSLETQEAFLEPLIFHRERDNMNTGEFRLILQAIMKCTEPGEQHRLIAVGMRMLTSEQFAGVTSEMS